MVGILIVGLIGTYVPLLFSAPPAPEDFRVPQNAAENQAAVAPATEESPAQPEVKKEEIVKPEGFSGLEEEEKSLEELNDVLGQ